MATLRQYFETDFPYTLRLHAMLPLGDSRSKATLHFDINGLTAFLSCFLPGSESPVSNAEKLLQGVEWGTTKLECSGKVVLPAARMVPCCEMRVENGDELQVFMRFAGDGEWFSIRDMAGTRRVFLYIEADLTEDDTARLKELAKRHGIALQVRANAYRAAREASEEPLAFISHDSRDKDAVARKLATSLQTMSCPVWYDEFRLNVGDRLRESIEAGLKTCKKCVLILSENFLNNTGWTKSEFNSVFTREIIEDRSLVLPIWVGVTKKQVYDYCPSLLNIVGIQWDANDPERVCREICRAVMA